MILVALLIVTQHSTPSRWLHYYAVTPCYHAAMPSCIANCRVTPCCCTNVAQSRGLSATRSRPTIVAMHYTAPTETSSDRWGLNARLSCLYCYTAFSSVTTNQGHGSSMQHGCTFPATRLRMGSPRDIDGSMWLVLTRWIHQATIVVGRIQAVNKRPSVEATSR